MLVRPTRASHSIEPGWAGAEDRQWVDPIDALEGCHAYVQHTVMLGEQVDPALARPAPDDTGPGDGTREPDRRVVLVEVSGAEDQERHRVPGLHRREPEDIVGRQATTLAPPRSLHLQVTGEDRIREAHQACRVDRLARHDPLDTHARSVRYRPVVACTIRPVDTWAILIGVAVVGSRFLVPLLIPLFPLPAMIACLVIDAVDQTVFQLLAPGAELDWYQGYDKALDIYYLSIAYLSTMRNWTNQGAFQVSRFLYYYRLVGAFLFEASGVRAVLLVFPNTFEYFFDVIEAIRVRWDPRRVSVHLSVGIAAFIWIFVKLPQEWWIHVAQLDTTDIIQERIFGVPAGTSWADTLAGQWWIVILFLVIVVLLVRPRMVGRHPQAAAGRPTHHPGRGRPATAAPRGGRGARRIRHRGPPGRAGDAREGGAAGHGHGHLWHGPRRRRAAGLPGRGRGGSGGGSRRSSATR